MTNSATYRAYTLANFQTIPQVAGLTEGQRREIETVARVLPFKTNGFVLGVSEIMGERVIALRFVQGRNPDWVHRPFFAACDEDALWLNELRPAFGEARFFFEDELEQYYRESLQANTADDFE